jgi:hypothetical protein
MCSELLEKYFFVNFYMRRHDSYVINQHLALNPYYCLCLLDKSTIQKPFPVDMHVAYGELCRYIMFMLFLCVLS